VTLAERLRNLADTLIQEDTADQLRKLADEVEGKVLIKPDVYEIKNSNVIATVGGSFQARITNIRIPGKFHKTREEAIVALQEQLDGES
jgi:hypothetical protein